MKIMLIAFLFIVGCGSIMDGPKVRKSVKGNNYVLYIGHDTYLVEYKIHSIGYSPSYKPYETCDTIISILFDSEEGGLFTGSGYWEQHLIVFHDKYLAEKTLKGVLRQKTIRDSITHIEAMKIDSAKQYTTYQ